MSHTAGLRVPIRCRCGALRGAAVDVAPRAGTHIVCYRDDCQAFARFLASDGITDAYGGTDIFPMAPSKLLLGHLGVIPTSSRSDQ